MQDAAAQRTITTERLEARERLRQTLEDVRAATREGQEGDAAGTVAPVGVATTQYPPPWFNPGDMPPRIQETAIAFFFTIAVIIIGLPIARAIGRRIDRMGSSPKVSAGMTSQLTQLNQAVEAIAVEVERISEGQRFTTKLLSEQHQLPAANRNVS